jgi:predicted NBD/HSP70 family sugar kinase
VRHLRDHGLLRILRAVHAAGAPYTRADMTRDLGISRGAASNLVADLRARRLVCEIEPTPTSRPGRPTAVLAAHPDGPVILVADVTHDDWQVAAVELGCRVIHVAGGRHRRRSADTVLGIVSEAVGAARRDIGARLVGLAVAAPGTFSGTRIVQASNLGWSQIDLGPWFSLPALPMTVGNDATFAGVAEARRGAARGAAVALHLHVHNGIGGTLLSGGSPIADAQGAGGEFGHMPFGDDSLICACGARGCWDQEVDGRALLRLSGGAPLKVGDVRSIATVVIRRAIEGDRQAHRALELVAANLARGISGLVNAHDPEVVTLSGTGADLLVAAPEVIRRCYLAGLMSFRRDDPPELLPTVLGDLGRILGAAEIAFDSFLTPAGIETWKQSEPSHSTPTAG